MMHVPTSFINFSDVFPCIIQRLNEKHQPDAVNKYIFHVCSVSTCFGQHIAHHQEINKMYKSAYGVDRKTVEMTPEENREIYMRGNNSRVSR